MAPARTPASCPNQGIVDMLEEKQSEPFLGTNFKRIITRAIRSIRALREPITSKEEALAVRGVGEYLATAIETHLANAPSAPTVAPSTSTTRQIASGATVLPDSDDEDHTPVGESSTRGRGRGRGRGRARGASSGTGRSRATDGQGGSARTYMPRYRSTPYAVLIALFLGQESGKLSMTKQELARAAQQYADDAVLVSGTADQQTWYDGWSSVNKTLIAKGLVAKGGNPVRYGLSAEGRVLADKLVKQDEQARGRTVNEYGAAPETAVVDMGREDVATTSREPPMEGSDGGRDTQVAVAKRARGKTTGGGGRLSKVQVERAVRVVARLESDFERESCLSVLRGLYEGARFPKSDDALYEVMMNILWEKERAGRENDTRSSVIQFSTPLRPISVDSPPQPSHSVQSGERNEGRQEKYFLCPNCGQRFSELIGAVHRMHCVSKQPSMRKDNSSPEVIAISDDDDDDDDDVRIIAAKHTAPVAKMRATAVLPSSLFDSSDDDFEDMRSSCYKLNSEPVRPRTERSEKSIDVDDVSSDDDIIAAPRPSSAARNKANCAGTRVELNEITAVESSASEDVRREKQCEIVFILDSMERLRSSNSMMGPVDSIAELMRRQGVVCETRSLPCGDGILVARYADGCQVVLDYIMERKTLSDYVSSMKDGRVARQSYMLQRCGVARRMFVLEGDMKSMSLEHNRAALLKKLAELEINEGFYVKHTKDVMDTVWFYGSLYKRLKAQFERVSKDEALRTRSEFGEWNERVKCLKTNMSLEQLFMLQLCETRGVAVGKARRVITAGYRTPQALLRAFERQSVLDIGTATGTRLRDLYMLDAYETCLRTGNSA